VSSDPQRWIESPPDAPSELVQMLKAAQATRPSPDELARVGARLGIPPASTVLPWGLKASLLGIAVGIGLLGWLVATRKTESGAAEPRPSQAQAEAAAVQPQEAPGHAEQRSEVQRRQLGDGEPVAVDREDDGRTPAAISAKGEIEQAKVVAPASHAAERPSPPTELSLIRAARSTVAQAPARALELTKTHRRLYPNGVLSEERELLAVRALEAMGRAAEAQQKQQQFDAAFPESVHAR